jgi:hypothetical protein
MRLEPRTFCVSVSTSIDSQETRKASICRRFQAAEGTRTLDLLHGKQTYIETVGRPFTCKSSKNEGSGPDGFCLRSRPVSPGFCPPIVHRDARPIERPGCLARCRAAWDASTPGQRGRGCCCQAIATVRNPRIRAAPSTRKGHSRLAPVGWTYTFLNVALSSGHPDPAPAGGGRTVTALSRTSSRWSGRRLRRARLRRSPARA